MLLCFLKCLNFRIVERKRKGWIKYSRVSLPLRASVPEYRDLLCLVTVNSYHSRGPCPLLNT